MPTYTYQCEVHGEFETSHSIKEELEECPQCQAEGLPVNKPKRLISLTSFILVGSGWAKDNYH
jgi:putative FmdB family regulatory protein